VRRYKTWLAEWNAMGAREEAAPPREKKPGVRRRVRVTIAALLLPAILVCLPYLRSNEEWQTALLLLWVVVFFYLTGQALRSITRRVKDRSRRGEAAVAPVEWMLGRASSSPSRSEASRKLPEHCGRLFSS
jgi:hypothetical protein